jgi:hypothetical protein
MLITLHRRTGSGNLPIYLTADDVQFVQMDYENIDQLGAIVGLTGGVELYVSETIDEIVEKLVKVLPDRWDDIGGV